MSSTTHIAGPVIVIRERAIQRCSVCGEKLVDSKGMMGVIEPDGSAPVISTWEVGTLVRQDGNVWATLAEKAGTKDKPGQYPEDGCLDLVE